jgi:hypothetical protein
MNTRVSIKTIFAAKYGNTATEYEDAFFPETGSYDISGIKCAVCDGATEAAFSGSWAKHVARSFAQGGLQLPAHEEIGIIEESIEEFLGVAREEWIGTIDRSSLPWYAEEQLDRGAFTTLVGMQFTLPATEKAGVWTCVAVGDSCLFQVRQGSLWARFPLTQSDQFNTSPYLISSKKEPGTDIAGHLSFTSRDLELNDTFYLMTDAISCWFLKQVEMGGTPWELLDPVLNDKDSLNTLLDQLRQEREIRNDDVTVMRIQIAVEQ